MKGFRIRRCTICRCLVAALFGLFVHGMHVFGQDQEAAGRNSKASVVDAPVVSTPDAEDRPLTKAIRLLEEKRLDEALEFAKRAEEDAPGEVETWIVLGKVLLRQGTAIRPGLGFAGFFRRDLLGAAEENFRKALDLDPSSLEARNHLCFTLFLLKNIPAAEDVARGTLKDHPDNAYGHYIIGKAQVEHGRPLESIPFFRTALSHDPLMLDARVSLVLALVAGGMRSEAAEELLELSRIDFGYEGFAALAQSVYEADELFIDAIDLYDRLLEIDPGRTEIRYRKAWVLYCLERFEEAEEVLDGILDVDPNHEKALYQKGYLRLREGRENEAYALFKRVLEKGSEFSYSIENHLQYLVQKRANNGDYAGAIEILDFILKHNPFNIIVLADRALTLSNWGKNDEADAAYEELIEIGSWDSSFLNDYALHLMGTGRIVEGLDRLKQAVEMDGNIDSMENLGAFYYYHRRDLEKATSYLKGVVTQEPGRTKALVLLESIRLQTVRGGN